MVKPIVTMTVLIGLFLLSVQGQNQVNRCIDYSHSPSDAKSKAVKIDANTLIKNRLACVEPKINREGNYIGPVVVRLRVNPEGLVDCVSIIRNIPDGIGDAVVEAVKKWKFKPFKVKDQLVAVTSIVAVDISWNASKQCANKEGQ